MRNFCKFLRVVHSGLLLTICLAASAKADTIESLIFTGTATCQASLNQICVPVGAVGAVTGNYALDVTSQTIMGAWSFTTPYGVISSSGLGAGARIIDNTVIAGVTFDEVGFVQSTTSRGAINDISFLFTGSNALTELGSLETVFSGIGGSICQSVGLGGCVPDIVITGGTSLAPTATPEPSTISLLLIGVGLLSLMIMTRKRISLGRKQAS